MAGIEARRRDDPSLVIRVTGRRWRLEKSMSGERIEFGGSATYRIVAQGILPANWRDRVGGMEIIDTTEGDDQPRVTLVGPVLDQTALRGVLETLYNLHMSIISISIERLKDQDEPA